MNKKLKTYSVSIQSYQLTSYRDMYDTMAKHWEYCGGTVIYNIKWSGDDHTLIQFKLTQPDDNIIITFSEVELT